MRIISKFRDYYDAAQAHGQDQRLVYVREHQQFKCPGEPAVPAFLAELGEPLRLRASSEVRSGRTRVLSPFLVAFAGKLYPGLRVAVQRGLKETVQYFYDWDSVQAHHADWSEEHNLFTFSDRTESRMKAHFALHGSTQMQAHLTAHRLGVVLVFTDGRHVVYEVNPSLQQLEFYRVLDAWQAFQELSMFWGGLAAPEKTLAPLAEADRLTQHGFDHMSFRKPPSTRKS